MSFALLPCFQIGVAFRISMHNEHLANMLAFALPIKAIAEEIGLIIALYLSKTTILHLELLLTNNQKLSEPSSTISSKNPRLPIRIYSNLYQSNTNHKYSPVPLYRVQHFKGSNKPLPPGGGPKTLAYRQISIGEDLKIRSRTESLPKLFTIFTKGNQRYQGDSRSSPQCSAYFKKK